MLCPQCGKSIEKLTDKVSLCEECSAASQKTAEYHTEFVEGQEAPPEDHTADIPPEENIKITPELKSSLNINLSKTKIALIGTILLVIFLVILAIKLFSSNNSNDINHEEKVKSKKSLLLESFSEEKIQPKAQESITPKPVANATEAPATIQAEASPVEAPITSENGNQSYPNLNELEASIKQLEAAHEVTPKIENTPSTPEVAVIEQKTPIPTIEVKISATPEVKQSSSPSPSPSPIPTLDESKLSEFDRRVLRARRLKELNSN